MEKEAIIDRDTKQQGLLEQFSDILLVMDKEKKTIRAVKGIGKDGALETVDADEKNQNQFMRIDRHGDMFSNFITNFWSQLKTPTHFRLFRVPARKAIEVAKQMQEHLNSPTPESEKLIKEHEVKTGPAASLKEKEQQNSDKMEITQSTQTAPETGLYRYRPEEIDWETMKNLGLSKERLEKKNLLDPLLKGYKTDELISVSVNLGTVVTRMDARLSLQRNEEGQVVAAVHGVRQKPNLNYPFFGHEFTKEDRENLLKTGNMGRIVELTSPKSGETILSVISVDRLTNELVAFRAENIKVQDEIKGVKLDEGQKQTLLEGKPLFLKGMISSKGKPFDATLQFNADKRYVEFIFPESRNLSNQIQQQEALKIFRGKELTEKQYEKLSEGKPVHITGLETKDGRKYAGYITYDSTTQKTAFSFNHPDKEQVPKAFRGKKLTDQQFNNLKDGKTIQVTGLVDQQGQEYSGYLTYNRETKKTAFSSTIPDELKNKVQPADTNKTQVAVNNDGKTNEATNKIDEPLKSGQQGPDSKKQVEQQKPVEMRRSRGRKM